MTVLEPPVERALRRIVHGPFYRLLYPEAGRTDEEAFKHYLAVGIAANLRPHPLFDPGYYLASNADVAATGVPAILHYLRHGGREWRVFSPLIDKDAYWTRYRSDVALTETGSALEDFTIAPQRDGPVFWFDRDYYVAQGEPSPEMPYNRAVEHFFAAGLAAGHDPHPLIELGRISRHDTHAERLSRLEALFADGNVLGTVPTHAIVDPAFYQATYGHTPVHPVIHFLRNGVAGTDLTPHPLFDPVYYCRTHGTANSVAAAVAYVRGGMDATSPNALFDPVHYRLAYGTAVGEEKTALQHYMDNGHLPWFDPSPRFAQSWYVTRHPGVARSGEPALVHFLRTVRTQGGTAKPPAPCLDPTLGRPREAVVAEIRLRARDRGAPVASVIIPVHGQLDVTLRCVVSILRAADATAFEIVLADDASPDNTGAAVAEAVGDLPGFRVLRGTENVGFLRTCNAAAATATVPYLLFLNNDTIVLDGWLDELVQTFDDVPEAGLVGAKLVYPSGVLQEAGGVVWSDGSAANFGRLDDADAPAYNYRRDVDYVSGAAILVSADAWRTVGGFSDAFAPAYYEDTDLAMKLRGAGYRVLYQPLATVVHVEGVTSGTDLAAGAKRYQVVNRERFVATWRDELARFGCSGDLSRATVDRAAKGRILFYDAEIPVPDRDSGSVTVVHYLRILSRLGYRVTFIAANAQRHGRYGRDLQRFGVEVLSTPYVENAKKYVLSRGGDYDMIVLSRAPVGGRFLPAVKAAFPDTPVVFDTVDLHHLRLMRQFEQTRDEATFQDALAMKRIELDAIRAADATLLVSEVEATIVRAEIGPFPHVVIPLIYAPYVPRTGFAERRDVAFVGGYRHPPNVDAARYLVEDIWPKVREAEGMAGARLHLIGSHMPAEVRDLAGDDILAPGHVEDLEAYLEGMRLTVAPLRYGAGVKGKVGNSLRLGVPVVATPVAVEGMNLEDERHVLVAANDAAFARSVARLYGDEGLWT